MPPESELNSVYGVGGGAGPGHVTWARVLNTLAALHLLKCSVFWCSVDVSTRPAIRDANIAVDILETVMTMLRLYNWSRILSKWGLSNPRRHEQSLFSSSILFPSSFSVLLSSFYRSVSIIINFLYSIFPSPRHPSVPSSSYFLILFLFLPCLSRVWKRLAVLSV
jgi:hypothetical protein